MRIDEIIGIASGLDDLRPAGGIGEIGAHDLAIVVGESRQFRSIDIDRKHPNPFAQQTQSHGPADAATGSGDDGPTIALCETHAVSCLPTDGQNNAIHRRATRSNCVHVRTLLPERLQPPTRAILKRYRDNASIFFMPFRHRENRRELSNSAPKHSTLYG
jgi:hypothetical protein